MLELHEVRSGYGRTEVIDGVSLAAGDDTATAILGHNGAGKSTLLKTLLGLIPVTSGRIVWDGEDITALPGNQRVRRGLAYVPQGQLSFGSLSTLENLQVVADSYSDASARVDEMLDMFPALVEVLDKSAGLLSGGQRQQLSIARALITRPRLLVLDEPTEGIQPSVVLEIEDKVRELAARSGTQVLLAEQKVGFALDVSDQFAILASGRIVSSGVSDEQAHGQAKEALAI